jgi:hypothetical protein
VKQPHIGVVIKGNHPWIKGDHCRYVSSQQGDIRTGVVVEVERHRIKIWGQNERDAILYRHPGEVDYVPLEEVS